MLLFAKGTRSEGEGYRGRRCEVLSEAGLLNKVRLGNLERYQQLAAFLANGPAKLLLFPCPTLLLTADTDLCAMYI